MAPQPAMRERRDAYAARCASTRTDDVPCCPSVESLTQHSPGASPRHTAAGIIDLPYMSIAEAVQVAFPPSQPYVSPLALPPAMDPLYARPVCNYDPPELASHAEHHHE